MMTPGVGLLGTNIRGHKSESLYLSESFSAKLTIT